MALVLKYGSRFQIPLSGYVSKGTSLSPPLWAGFMADVNEIRASHDFTRAGFVNSILHTKIYTNSSLYAEVQLGTGDTMSFSGTACELELLRGEVVRLIFTYQLLLPSPTGGKR